MKKVIIIIIPMLDNSYARFYSKGLVTHNDILKIYRSITIKKYFQNILKSFLKYFRKKRFSKQKTKFI